MQRKKTCNSNLQLKKSTIDIYTTVTERYCTHQVPFMCFYAARLERGHPWGAIKIDFKRRTNGLVFNYEYSDGDCNVTNYIDPVDDVMTVAIGLWVVLCTGDAH